VSTTAPSGPVDLEGCDSKVTVQEFAEMAGISRFSDWSKQVFILQQDPLMSQLLVQKFPEARLSRRRTSKKANSKRQAKISQSMKGANETLKGAKQKENNKRKSGKSANPGSKVKKPRSLPRYHRQKSESEMNELNKLKTRLRKMYCCPLCGERFTTVKKARERSTDWWRIASNHLLQQHTMKQYEQAELKREASVAGGWKTKHPVYHHYGNTYVAPSEIPESGLGLFAAKDFKPPAYGKIEGKINELVIERNGEVLSFEEPVAQHASSSKKAKDSRNQPASSSKKAKNKNPKGLFALKRGDLLGRYCVAERMMDWWEFKTFFPTAEIDWSEEQGKVNGVMNFEGPYSDRVMMLNLDCCDWFLVPFGEELKLFERDNLIESLGPVILGWDTRTESMGLEGIRFAVCYENRARSNQPLQHLGSYANDFAFHLQQDFQYWECSKMKNNSIPIPVIGVDPRLSKEDLSAGKALTFIGSVLMASKKINAWEEIGMCYGPGASTANEYKPTSSVELPQVPEYKYANGLDGEAAKNVKEALANICESTIQESALYFSKKYDIRKSPAPEDKGPFIWWEGGIHKKKRKKGTVYHGWVRGMSEKGEKVTINMGDYHRRTEAEEAVKEFTHHPSIRPLLRKDSAVTTDTKVIQQNVAEALGLEDVQENNSKKRGHTSCNSCGYPAARISSVCPACHTIVKKSEIAGTILPRIWKNGQKVLAKVPKRFHPNKLEWRPAIILENSVSSDPLRYQVSYEGCEGTQKVLVSEKDLWSDPLETCKIAENMKRELKRKAHEKRQKSRKNKNILETIGDGRTLAMETKNLPAPTIETSLGEKALHSGETNKIIEKQSLIRNPFIPGCDRPPASDSVAACSQGVSV